MARFQDVSIHEMQQVEGGYGGGYDWGAYFTGITGAFASGTLF